MAALPYYERNKQLEAFISVYRVDGGSKRQEFHFRFPCTDTIVCQKYYCFFHGISKSTLGRIEIKMKESLEAISSERVHRNLGR